MGRTRAGKNLSLRNDDDVQSIPRSRAACRRRRSSSSVIGRPSLRSIVVIGAISRALRSWCLTQRPLTTAEDWQSGTVQGCLMPYH